MKNYRLTQRGKIVFTGLFIVLIIALVLMVSFWNKETDSVSDELMINTGEIEKDNEALEKSDEFIEENTSEDDKDLEKQEDSKLEDEVDKESDSMTNEATSQDTQTINSNETSDEKLIENSSDIVNEDFKKLYTLYFLPDKFIIDEKNSKILDEYYKILNINDNEIILEGNYHVGKDYDEKMFVHLSSKRALCVKEYLVKKGIDEKRISIIDNKSLKPLSKDSSDNQIGLNRRVDIYFKGLYTSD